VNFQQLRSVRETIRHNFNLTEVANALFTSQPGVSRQIRELEEELGIDIFERNGKRLTGLTEPGKEVLHIIERLLLEAENLQRAGLTYSSKSTGTLSIAAIQVRAQEHFLSRQPIHKHAMFYQVLYKNFVQPFQMYASLFSKAHPSILLNGSCQARLM